MNTARTPLKAAIMVSEVPNPGSLVSLPVELDSAHFLFLDSDDERVSFFSVLPYFSCLFLFFLVFSVFLCF